MWRSSCVVCACACACVRAQVCVCVCVMYVRMCVCACMSVCVRVCVCGLCVCRNCIVVTTTFGAKYLNSFYQCIDTEVNNWYGHRSSLFREVAIVFVVVDNRGCFFLSTSGVVTESVVGKSSKYNRM